MATMNEEPDDPTAKDDKPKPEESDAKGEHAEAEPNDRGTDSVGRVPASPVTQTEAE